MALRLALMVGWAGALMMQPPHQRRRRRVGVLLRQSARPLVDEAVLLEAPNTTLVMERLKGLGDVDGLGGAVGDGLEVVFGSKVRRRLWTKADRLHVHAVSGTIFLVGGGAWLLASLMQRDVPGTPMLLLSGAICALSAIPMARFKSNKFLDLEDLKSNGFTFGGAGLTLMSLHCAWWFSGSYPGWLQPWNLAFFMIWSLVCLGTTLNWELMLQQNIEEETASKRQQDQSEKDFLYRFASYPNLTQILFLWNIAAPDAAESWFARVLEAYPNQGIPLFHYGMASGLGYALSMFSETLRDRKLISLRADVIVLVIATIAPMLVVGLDALILGDSVTAWPPDYWRLFNPEF